MYSGFYKYEKAGNHSSRAESFGKHYFKVKLQFAGVYKQTRNDLLVARLFTGIFLIITPEIAKYNFLPECTHLVVARR